MLNTDFDTYVSKSVLSYSHLTSSPFWCMIVSRSCHTQHHANKQGVKSMGVTISTHNGSAVAREHNIRNPKVVSKEAHIKPNGKFEIWCDEKPRDAYNRLFGQALEEYNNKQKRADRKIKDYYRHICDDKVKHPVYEMIVAIGSRNNSIDEETGYSILREFYNGWRERNPNLELIGAYYHADEDGVPHVHIDYVPVATGYVYGMSVQTALVKALEQQGFKKEGKATAQIQWEKRENMELERLCNLANIEVEHPLIEGRKHLDTAVYRAQQELKKAQQSLQYMQANIQDTELMKQASEHFLEIAYEKEKIADEKAKKAQEQAEQKQMDLETLQRQISELENKKKALEYELSNYQDILDKRLAWDAEERFCFARLSSHLFERFVPIAKEMYLCYAYSRLEDGKVIINAPKSESEFLALALAKAKGLLGQENKGNSPPQPPRLRR